MEPLADEARSVALERVRSFLARSDTSDFHSADHFAESMLAEVRAAYEGSLASPRAEAIIRRITKDIYTYYRLKDTSALAGEAAPVKFRFGGPDVRAIEFFDRQDRWFFSSFIDNRRQDVYDFFRREYLERGTRLFGRESPESLDEFRKLVGGKLESINDRGVQTILRSSVQRIRNYAHINQLAQARIYKLAKIIAIIDNRTTEICLHLDGKYIRLAAAAEAVDRLTRMDPGEYALELYKSAQGRAFAQNAVGYVEGRVHDDVVDDDLVAEGRGFPPYHPNCRTRVAAVLKGAPEPKSGAEQVAYDESQQ